MASLDLQVAASTDDAQELNGTVTVDGAALNANTTTQHTGLRFIVPPEKIAELKGAIINDGTYASLYFTTNSFDDPDVTFWMEDADAAAAYAATTNNISSRTPTDATVGWDASGVGTGYNPTPDLKSLVQEVVLRPNWNGILNLIYKGDDNNSAIRIRAYDNEPSQAATLHLEYTPVTHLTAAGLPTDDAFGVAQMTAALDQGLTADGLPSDEAFGTAALSAPLEAEGLASDEAIGAATVTPLAAPLTAAGLESDEAFGQATASVGTATITAGGLPSDDDFGTATVAPLAAPLTAAGLPGDEQFGTVALTTVGAQTLTATGLASDDGFGAVVVRPLRIELIISSNSVEQSNGTTSITGTARDINPTSKYNAWFIPNLALPPSGVSFHDVRLQLRPFSFDDPNLIFYLEDSSSPAALAATTNDISSRSRTEAEVAWDEDNVGIETFVDSPNLGSLFQEVYDAGGWVEGVSDFVLIAEDQGGAIRYYSGLEPNAALRPRLVMVVSIIGPQALQASGLASDEAIGTPALTAGEVGLTADSLPSDEAIETATLILSLQPLTAESLASDEAFGPAVMIQEQFLEAGGLASDEMIGGAAVSNDQPLTAVGLDSDEDIGTAVTTAGDVGLTAAGLPSDEAIGGAAVDLLLLADGLESDEAFGQVAVVGGDIGLTAEGLASDDDFGLAAITAGEVGLTAAGLDSDEAIGGAAAGLVLVADGLASDEATGGAVLAVGVAALAAAGLASDEGFGQTTIAAGEIGVVVESLASDESLGDATITLHLVAGGLASDEAIGTGGRVARVFDNPGHAGQLAWWPLDEAAGSATWMDVHSGGHHLTAVGDIGSTAGVVGGAAVFESANSEYLALAGDAFSSNGGSFSISGWITPTATALDDFRYIVTCGSITNSRLEYALRVNPQTDRLEFLTSSNGAAGGVSILFNTVTMTAGNRYFFAITYDHTTKTKRLTVNETTVSSTVTGVHDGAQEFYIGFLHNLSALTFDGAVDEVNAWNVALSSSNVSWLYNDGFGRSHEETGVVIFAQSLASDEAIGDAVIEVGAAELVASGLVSDEAFGLATLDVGTAVLAAVGLVSDEAFGLAVVTAARTPDGRTLYVLAESRVYVIEPESRVYEVVNEW